MIPALISYPYTRAEEEVFIGYCRESSNSAVTQALITYFITHHRNAEAISLYDSISSISPRMDKIIANIRLVLPRIVRRALDQDSKRKETVTEPQRLMSQVLNNVVMTEDSIISTLGDQMITSPASQPKSYASPVFAKPNKPERRVSSGTPFMRPPQTPGSGEKKSTGGKSADTRRFSGGLFQQQIKTPGSGSRLRYGSGETPGSGSRLRYSSIETPGSASRARPSSAVETPASGLKSSPVVRPDSVVETLASGSKVRPVGTTETPASVEAQGSVPKAHPSPIVETPVRRSISPIVETPKSAVSDSRVHGFGQETFGSGSKLRDLAADEGVSAGVTLRGATGGFRSPLGQAFSGNRTIIGGQVDAGMDGGGMGDVDMEVEDVVEEPSRKRSPSPPKNASPVPTPRKTELMSQSPFGTELKSQSPFGTELKSQSPFGTELKSQSPFGPTKTVEPPRKSALASKSPFSAARSVGEVKPSTGIWVLILLF
jgi:hypothetical protein